MQLIRKNGSVSNILRATLRNSSTGAGLTGLTFGSGGLIISTICDNEAAATVYTAAGSTTETITTLATYATPTATKCRFKEVDATNHPGLYELQFADARFAVTNAKTLRICISGATNLLTKEILVQLSQLDFDSPTVDVMNRTWFVAKTGSDSNPGTRTSPFLTIGAAVTAASDGDYIRIGAGTYSELVNASAKSLHFRSPSASLVTITGSDTVIPTMRVRSCSSVHNLTITATATNQPVAGLKIATTERDVEVRGCIVTAPFDGLQANLVANLRLYDCEFYGNYDSANVNDCRGFEAHRCYFQSDASYSNGGTGDVEFRAVNAVGDGFSGVFYNCRLQVTRSSTQTAGTVAIAAGRDLRLIDTSLHAYVTNAAGTSEACGIVTTNVTLPNGALVTRGVHYDITSAGSTPVKHARTGNCTLYDHGSNVDSTLVVGTMIRMGLDWARVLNQSTAVSMPSTLIGGVTEVGTVIEVDGFSAGALAEIAAAVTAGGDALEATSQKIIRILQANVRK